MNPASYAVTFACYNQVEYTRQCVESMVRHGPDLSRVVVVDNASQDATRAYLEAQPFGARIYNRQNLGCGVAWNQGALALQADWTVVMNNDVVVTAGWLERLIGAAESRGLLVASPALIEGELDYDLDAWVAGPGQRMAQAIRPGAHHAVCMAIHRSVWDRIGYFRATPSLWGYEDALFFHEVHRAGIPTAVVGASWLHHFGSITLSALKRERGLSQAEGLSARDSFRLLGQSWFARKMTKLKRLQRERAWRAEELARYGTTLHGDRRGGVFTWR